MTAMAFSPVFVAAWLGLFFSPAAHAKPLKLVTETSDGPYALVFDPARISRTDMEAALLVAPTVDPPGLGIVLEACSPKDPAYKDCGDGSPESPHFLENAAVNHERAVRAFQELKAVKVPRALRAAKDHLLRTGAFYAFLLKARLDFYKTSQLFVLQKKFADIEPEKSCVGSLDAIRDAKTRAEAFKLARVDWHNCMNAVFNKRYGKYPKDVWEAFLKKYRVREERSLAGQ